MTPPPNDPALEELREAHAGGNLIVCAGPGVSTAAGLPDKRNVVELLVERARARGASPESIAEIVDLLGRSQLADALSAAKQALGAPEFHSVVERALDDRKREVPEAARALAALAPRLRAVVTTNLDHLLERAFGGQWPALARAPGDLAQRRGFILKLHGTLLESGTWVLTREDDDRAMYADPRLQTAFTALFNTCPILFVGYGPADDDFDALLGRVRALSGGQPPRHFALMDRATIRPGRRAQLEEAGLRIIPYENPDGTHRAVIDVLRHLAAEPAPASTAQPPARSGPDATPASPTPPNAPPAPTPTPGPRMGTTLADDLREAIQSGGALFLVGSGVSVGATQRNPWASWQGLIEDGLAECEKAAGVSPALADTYRQQLKSNDLDALLTTAEFVSRKLGAPAGGDYRAWLRRTVGALRAGYREVLDALRALPGLLATTNYDGLLEEVTGLEPVTWRQRNELELVLNGRERGILHLHGHWKDSESVVLSVRDYHRIVSDPHTQTVLRSSLLMKTVVFVGCGEGLADPNFGALLEWARGVFADSERVHYRLALEKDVDMLRQQHRADRIKAVSYGADFGALAPFLRSLT